MGGFTCTPDLDCSQNLVTLKSMEIYNPKTNVWKNGPSLKVARSGLAAVTGPDGTMYAIGGGILDVVGEDFGAVYGTLEAYSPTTNRWTTLAPMPTPRFGLSAVVGTDGRIYAIGGENAAGTELRTVEAYTPSSNTWTTEAPMPSGYAFGAGIRDRQGHIDYVGLKTYQYSISTNTWTTLAPSPNVVAGVGGARGPDGRLYVVGGMNTYGMETNAAEGYNPTSNTWSSIASMPEAAFAIAAARGTDGRIYVIDGGANYGESCCAVPLSIVQVLTV